MNVNASYFSLFAEYLLSPAIVGAIIIWGLAKTFKFGEMKQTFEAIKNDVGELKIKSGNMISNITVIKTHLVDKAGMNASLFQTMSPISLTKAGENLVREIGFEVLMSENYDDISKNFIVSGADSLLKLDEISEVVVNDLFTQGKLPSYENEAFKRGISLEVLLRACALYLRSYMAKKLSVTE